MCKIGRQREWGFVLPVDAAQASRQFGTFSAVMRHASATYSVPWTVIRAGAIDVIMRAHGKIENAKAQTTTQKGLSLLCKLRVQTNKLLHKEV